MVAHSRTNPAPGERRRVLVFDIQPSVDAGRYAAKRVEGDVVEVSCDLVADGHDFVAGAVIFSVSGSQAPREVPLLARGNDRYAASIVADTIGRWSFAIEAWVDEFATWRHNIIRKRDAGQDVRLELMAGALLIAEARTRAASQDELKLELAQSLLEQAADQQLRLEEGLATALAPELLELMSVYPRRSESTKSQSFDLVVDSPIARFSAWYELFPRSFGRQGAHGTFADVEGVLPYVASMGFDVLYLPPIHPIGKAFRKGPNNTLEAGENDPGSPWAIGAKEGGHKEIHPQLGSVEDFERLVARAEQLGLRVALDIAFQASPDHPYVSSHPEWFQRRADGTIQYAENPPKKYQDVYPFDLAGPESAALWEELKSVFDVWIERGVRIFRVDNPHTKPIRFWEYCISEIKDRHPDVVFLAEAFTRPKLMYALAKVGFTQSYTYFTWRTTSHDLKSYLVELTSTPVREFFRPNFWPNTPDILPEHLQYGGRATYVSRMVLAGTLSASWGIYGPPFELMESVARPGSEEYIDNEKFQLRSWDLQAPRSLRPLIARLNKIRRDNPALQRNDTLVFHDSDNDNVLAYSKTDEASRNIVLTVVNLEAYHRHSAWLTLDLSALGVQEHDVFQVHDLMSDARYQWHGSRVFVVLDPEVMPVHIFRLRLRLRTEQSFEYYL